MLEELERVSESEGISRSAALQRSAEMYIASRKWMTAEGKIAGVTVIHYDHEAGGIEEKLTDIQHDFMDVIISALHIHLTKNECMLIIAVRGNSNRIREFVDGISKLHGIKNSQFFPVAPLS
ncbi:MAG: CopG family ribbon-helix-helix protein [Fervidicoccaceae archaeon]